MFLRASFSFIMSVGSTLIYTTGLLSSACYAAESIPLNNGSQVISQQQQRQKAMEKHLNPTAKDVRLLPSVSSSGKVTFPQEKKCFLIKEIFIEGKGKLPWGETLQTLANQASGKCVGGEGINLLVRALQNRLVERGYITTRVIVPEQNLKSGTLKLKLVLGRIGKVKLDEKSDRYIRRYNTLPAHAGNLLNLRDIEQGLENLQRLPTTQAAIKIKPGEQPGESDINVNWQQQKMWRLGVTLDDAGNVSTGRYQGALSLSVDNPSSLGDLLYFSTSKNLHNKNHQQSKNITVHYSVPLGYWTLGATAYHYEYLQRVSGLYQDFRYGGQIKNVDVQISRVLHRGRSHKTSFTYNILARESSNYIQDVWLPEQARRTSAWRLGLQHRHYLGQTTLDAAVSYQRGTRWFGAQPAPEERSGYATALGRIGTLSLQVNTPFQLMNQQFRFNTSYFQQFSKTALTSPDQISIGNRYTVRGFDGERTLMASEGWFLRNDIAWRTPLPNQELYFGFDYGKVSGSGSEYLAGTHLAGGQLGIRGNAFNGSYNLFAGVPFSKPDAFATSPVTLGFTLSWNY
ncbi:ShlB/FhaC/HecB family hemolysin secretion/activation protein [Erwinia sp. BNK-24-b]|uniref:ShlB/FhaC/HecB family hemolysin secretion/activation protein n=1 Tax=unclassified Erwinia TaxID=2622719 RepID=UPI0039BEDCFC